MFRFFVLIHLCGPGYNIQQQLAEVSLVIRFCCTRSLMLHLNSLPCVLKRIVCPFRTGKTGQHERERKYKIKSVFFLPEARPWFQELESLGGLGVMGELSLPGQ
jgi:hypothetical protein